MAWWRFFILPRAGQFSSCRCFLCDAYILRRLDQMSHVETVVDTYYETYQCTLHHLLTPSDSILVRFDDYPER